MIGISKDTWQQTEGRLAGFELVPEGIGLRFEITDARQGVSKKNDQPYLMLACTHVDDSGAKTDHWEYFELSHERLPFLKGFLEAVGRHDFMEGGEESEPEQLFGTVFEADCRHRTFNGEKRSNLMAKTIVNVNYDRGEPIAMAQPEEDPGRRTRGDRAAVSAEAREEAARAAADEAAYSEPEQAPAAAQRRPLNAAPPDDYVPRPRKPGMRAGKPD